MLASNNNLKFHLRRWKSFLKEHAGEDHDHDEEHEMALEIKGVKAGSTSFKLELMHDGHADYTSTNPVPITVK